jgi:hypothetical protein
MRPPPSATPYPVQRRRPLGAIALTLCGLLIAGAAAAAELAYRPTALSLYQPEAVLKARVDNRLLAGYVHEVSGAARAVFSSAPRGPGVTGAIVVAVKPGGGSRVWLVLGDNTLATATAEALVRRAGALAPLAVQNGPVAFALNFEAWGGGKPITTAQQPRPVPEDWARAIAGVPDAVLPDAALAKLWP